MLKRFVLFVGLLGLFAASCKKYPIDEPIIPKKPDPVDSTYLYHFIGTVGSVDFTLYDGLNSYINSTLNVKTPASPPDSPTVAFSSTLGRPGNNQNSLVISKGILKHGPPSPTDKEFETFFQLGDYFYTGPFNTQGITIEWTDENGKKWSTLNGDQNGSTFTITEVKKKYVSGVTVLDVRIGFSCSVYDINGTSIALSSAEFYGAFKNN
jgi:hypothetical protein